MTEAKEQPVTSAKAERKNIVALVRALLAGLPVPVLLLDSARIVLAVNGAAESSFKKKLVGQDLAQSIRNPDLLQAVDQVIDGAPAKVQEAKALEIILSSQTPRIYQVSVSALGLPDERLVLVTFIDLTSARHADAVRSTFVANVSHELRSPLTTLMGAVEALEGPARDGGEGRRRMLALMGQEARRMKNLIDDLLSLSRVEAQEFIPPGKDVALVPLLEGARDRLADRAAARDIEIKLDLADKLPIVSGVEDELFQVFDNLISNAIKYGDRSSIVTVTATAGDSANSAARVAIHNVGAPIAPEHLPRLTERFYRIDKSRSRELGGTGLGLAIVKHIVARHRGRLLIDSAEGEGTTFTLLLPASR